MSASSSRESPSPFTEPPGVSGALAGRLLSSPSVPEPCEVTLPRRLLLLPGLFARFGFGVVDTEEPTPLALLPQAGFCDFRPLLDLEAAVMSSFTRDSAQSSGPFCVMAWNLWQPASPSSALSSLRTLSEVSVLIAVSIAVFPHAKATPGASKSANI